MQNLTTYNVAYAQMLQQQQQQNTVIANIINAITNDAVLCNSINKTYCFSTNSFVTYNVSFAVSTTHKNKYAFYVHYCVLSNSYTLYACNKTAKTRLRFATLQQRFATLQQLAHFVNKLNLTQCTTNKQITAFVIDAIRNS